MLPLNALLAISLAAVPADAQSPARALADEIARALGGAERIMAVNSLVVRGTGLNYNLGQNRTPDAPLGEWAVTSYTRWIDFANSRWRLDQAREPRFPAVTTTAQRQRFGYDVVAYDILSDTSMRRSGGRLTQDRRAELIYHPIGFMKAALAPGANIAEAPATRTTRALRLTTGGESYTMVVDAATKLPMRVTRKTHQGMLGDVTISMDFSNYTSDTGIRIPLRVVQKLDDRWPVSDLTLTEARTNVDVGEIAAPESIKAAPVPPPPTVTVTVDSIAPGVWYVTGGTHHSVAIEMRDHLLLVESPQNEDRTLAVIRRVRELRPSKPIRAVINTHHHFDHAGGVRAAMSEGLTVITHERNRAFFDSLAARSFTIVPDALARSRKSARVEGVMGKRVITDGTRTVELHEINGSDHSGSILMVYLPAEKLLVQADLYSAPAANATTLPPTPYAKGLVENIDRLRLDVERMVPIHGRVVPMSDVRAAASR
jgi:glyoxylase-like metal-dependent hydrolase (beta-lactamase superfamily II)